MQINQLDSIAGTNNSSGAAPNNQLTGDSFITLLVAQLQAQDPTNPMDPTQFVAQLVQFNTLEQTIQIRQDLDAIAAGQAHQTTAAAPATKY